MNRTLLEKDSGTHKPLSSAYLLVSHGSRDPRPQAAVEQLAELIRDRVAIESAALVQNSVSRVAVLGNALQPMVGTACLELAEDPLHEQIWQFGDRAVAIGYKRLELLPLFLLPGVHVQEDIPLQVAKAQQTLGSKLTIEIQPHLGSHPGLGYLLANQLGDLGVDARIVLSHGSRRAGGNKSVEAIAGTLGAIPAYWSVQPSLEARLLELVTSEHKKIEIVPYFLFSGGITDAIARAVAQHRVQFPSASLHLADPIGASAELAELIWDLRSK